MFLCVIQVKRWVFEMVLLATLQSLFILLLRRFILCVNIHTINKSQYLAHRYVNIHYTRKISNERQTANYVIFSTHIQTFW